MKTNISTLFWGLVLILVGGFMLASEMGYIQNLSEQTWMLVFAAASIVFWVVYFVTGIQAWGWLFPACIFSGLSAAMYIADKPVAGEWTATVVVGSVALPFLVGFLLDRARWGLLIPAFVLGFVAFIAPLTSTFSGEGVGIALVALIGLPFLVAYLATPRAWWAIIPAGILLSIAAMIALSGIRFGFEAGLFAVGAMFLGWAFTFALVWLRRDLHPASWAKYPAIGLVILAGITLVGFTAGEIIWSIGLIIAGLVLIALGLRPRREQTDTV